MLTWSLCEQPDCSVIPELVGPGYCEVYLFVIGTGEGGAPVPALAVAALCHSLPIKL